MDHNYNNDFYTIIKPFKKEKPDYLIIHLLTISPLIINFFFNIKTKIILDFRITKIKFH